MGQIVLDWGFPCGSVVKNPPANCRRPAFNPWVGKIPWRRKWPTHSSLLVWRIPRTEAAASDQGLDATEHVRSRAPEGLITGGPDALDAKSKLPSPHVKTKHVSRHCLTSLVGQNRPWMKTSLFGGGWQRPEEVRQKRQKQPMVKMAKTR